MEKQKTEKKCGTCIWFSGSGSGRCDVDVPWWAEPTTGLPRIYAEDGSDCETWESYRDD